jgi:CheY-like chemotaxis protein
MNSRPCILFVEDDDNDVILMRRACEVAGFDYHFVAVEDSRKAIEHLQKSVSNAETPSNIPKLVLLDLKLIGSSGFEVLEWLQDRPERKDIPVIVFSSSWVEADVERAQSLGADDYIVKPNGFQELLDVCRKIDVWIRKK